MIDKKKSKDKTEAEAKLFMSAYNKNMDYSEQSILNEKIAIAPSGTFDLSAVTLEIQPASDGYTKISNDLIKQTISSSSIDQPSLFDKLLKDNPNYGDECKLHNIDRIGTKLSVSSHYALIALQTLFTDTDYKGNTKDGSLQITVSDYLEAYGVNKTLTKRGKHEYNRQERENAIEALRELTKPILWYIKKLNDINTKKRGKPSWDYLNGITSIIELITVRTDITNDEGKLLEQGDNKALNQKIAHFIIKPSKLFLGIENGVYAFIPRSIIQKIRQLYKKPPSHLFPFMNILVLEARGHRYSVKRYYDTLAENLNLQHLIKTRQKKRLAELLEENFERAKELGLLSSYKIDKDYKGYYVTLELNRNAFYQENRLKGNKTLPLPDKTLEELITP